MNAFSMRVALGLLLAAALCARAAELPHSTLEWREPAQPQKYFDSTGRRAAAFGLANGQFEAWVYPIKVLHGFRLEFQQEGMLEPVRGEALLREVIARPEGTTLVYAHSLFTLKQTIWAPLDSAALVQFLELDSARPLVVTASFVPDLKPMWPASLGGQHSGWNRQQKAIELTDATEIATALIGSPAVDAATEFMDHQLIGGEMRLRLRIEPNSSPAVVVVAGAMGRNSAELARAGFRSVAAQAMQLFAARVISEQHYLDSTRHLESGDAALDRQFEWAKVAIHSGWVCRPANHAEIAQLSGVPDVAGPECGLIAGYGPSGEGERPGFGWWFGGDAMMSSWAMEDFGDLAGAADALRFLKARQRPDGKMMHEMSQSVDVVDWFGKYHFAYYHADTTPMYLYSIWRYASRSNDREFAREFWPSARKAYEYCVLTLDAADGLMDNTKAGLAAVEVGVLRGKVVKDIYLEGFWVGALQAMADFAGRMNEPELAADAKSRLSKAAHSLQTEWWNPEQEYFAFGMTADGRRADLVGNWPSVLLALSSSIDRDKATAELQHLASPEVSTDWGTRWLSNTSELYDPVSYNNGTVWPFMQAFVALAQFQYGDPVNGCITVEDTARLTGLQSPGALPEHMNGDRFLPGERSVPHQLFSSAAVVLGAMRLQAAHAQCRPAAQPNPGERSSPRH
ncbi:MAG TPA: GH116 family glycosyl hydrolase [Terriglobales bacterium]|nr:GH116 family glycosyl hydrolase [Terriglobales bacterium]